MVLFHCLVNAYLNLGLVLSIVADVSSLAIFGSILEICFDSSFLTYLALSLGSFKFVYFYTVSFNLEHCSLKPA